MHAFHPNYLFNANEVGDEYNLLNDFLSTSLFEETGMYSTEEFQGHFNDPSFVNSMAASASSVPVQGVEAMIAPDHGNNGQLANQNNAAQAALISRPSSAKPVTDKAREKYYMMAADPTGAEPPEERMNKLLKAKYDAGMLRPFNYVNGYARLNKYMEKNMKQSSRHKILMQLDQFRPKFRERMQSLTDIELVLVEMWFERSLMEYDRIFASMAIPACCWRRTGEIFRGNKEMAELIQVPIESLRDVSDYFPDQAHVWLTLSSGQTRHSRNHRRGSAGQLLGKVLRNLLRPTTKGDADQLYATVSEGRVGHGDSMLLLLYHSQGQS